MPDLVRTVPAAPGHADDPLLSVADLTATFRLSGRDLPVLQGVSFSVRRGKTVALVGESGSGKSVTALSVMRLLRQCALGGRIAFAGRDLLSLSAHEMARIRGREIAMIFQEPRMSLNPTMTVGEQIAEVLRRHRALSRGAAKAEALRHLDLVRIPSAASRYDAYPHHLSGGMCQRVMIASAIAGRPQLLIADEPTTALDVTVQAEILNLLRDLQAESGMAMLFVTHDMGVVAELADEGVVMRHGRVVEAASTHDLFDHPRHPYSRDLLAAVPKLGAMAGTDGPWRVSTEGAASATPVPAATPPCREIVLSVRGLCVRYDLRSGYLRRTRQRVHAVEHVSFDLRAGETLALVGESGCGKSTTGRAILGLARACAGQVILAGTEMTALRGSALRQGRRAAQMIFQDPFASLSPRQRVRDAISEPLRSWGETEGIGARVDELLSRVGLDPAMGGRLPHEFSGGQRQRICIARALALNPAVIVADEAVSALDVLVKARICNLLVDVQREFGLACLFISHDIAVVERLSDRVAVMRFGEIVEIGSRRAVFETPRHPYTRALLAAVPSPDPQARRAKRVEIAPAAGSSLKPVDHVAVPRRYREVAAGHLVVCDGDRDETDARS